MSQRKVTVLSTKTNEQKEITTDVTTWGQLKPVLSANGFDPSGLKAMLQATKVTLENDSAVLPDGDFVLFLTPGKVKSGN